MSLGDCEGLAVPPEAIDAAPEGGASRCGGWLPRLHSNRGILRISGTAPA
jgi:hypothetical protein